MKIGIFSASAPMASKYPHRAKRAIEFLKDNGHEIVLGNLFYQNQNYRTGTIQQRAQEFNELLKNDDLDVLMSSIGGVNTNSILPYLDYESLSHRSTPLVVCGFSDTTALLLAIQNKVKNPLVRLFYGPALIPSFGDIEPEFKTITYESFLTCLHSSKDYFYVVPKSWTDDSINWEEYQHEKQIEKQTTWGWDFFADSVLIAGRLVGGNANTLLGTFGSEYGLKIQEGDILLLEDSWKDASTVEKNFSACLLNGVFDKVKGIILGKYEQFDDQETGFRPVDLLNEILLTANKKIPIVYDVDFSHTKPMLIGELNQPIILDGKTKTIAKVIK